MAKLYRDMSEEEKEKVYARTERYRKKNIETYQKASLKYYYNNKEKCAEKAKRWREENKEYIKIKQREDKRNRKDKAILYLGSICKDCNNNFHPAIFEFHHRNPDEKGDRDPSKFLSLRWERVQEELDKCDLLCANCHRLRHHKENYADSKI